MAGRRAACSERPAPSLAALLVGATHAERIILQELAVLLSRLAPGSGERTRVLGQTETDIRQSLINDGWPVEVAIYNALILTDALEREAVRLRAPL